MTAKKHTPKKRISQQTFDAAVNENIIEFDMNRDEAIEDAITQFEAQGIDLSNIIKTDLHEQCHPVINCIKTLEDTMTGTATASDFIKCIDVFNVECSRNDETRAIAGTYKAIDVLTEALLMIDNDTGTANAFTVSALTGLEQCFLFEHNRPMVSERTLKGIVKALKAFPNDSNVLLRGISSLKYACLRNETNRIIVMDEDISNIILVAMKRYGDNADIVRESCACLRVLTQDDDLSHTYGNAYENAKILVLEGGLELACELLRTNLNSPTCNTTITAELCSVLGRLSVRNEYCEKIIAQGGLELVFKALDISGDQEVVMRQACALVKAVAGNDDVRQLIASKGGIVRIVDGMRTHCANASVVEQCSAALVSLSLRNPDNCLKIEEAGGIPALINAMRRHPKELKLCRHVCMALRNIVSRNPELKPVILDYNAEEIISSVRKTHPTIDEVAKAALRDLGCDVQLQELFTGIPISMIGDVNGDIL